ncbi:uncharacterized protein [Triticum aestivum]|uniref:uncharacterized protein n=1 Tax=Triticum aestivum TaxID=4565 RepID=UPI0008451061|nr:uncharacterized protein LOC123187141 [Triticum aestivum]
MPRRPRRVQAHPVAAQLGEEGRPLRERLRFAVRRGTARGGPAVRALLWPLCRAVALGGRHLLRVVRRGMARGGRHLLRPFRLLRRGLELGGRALQRAALALGRPLRLLWRALELGGHALQRRALAHGRRLLVSRVRQQEAVYGDGDSEPRTPPRPTARGTAIFYDPRGRRPRPPSLPLPPPPLPPPPQPSPPPPVVVDGVDVPRHIVDLFVDYCRRSCPANSTICHFCVFEIQRSRNFTVATWEMPGHCQRYHSEEGASVRCPVAGCHVRVRPGRDLALHSRFVHDFPPGWWRRYI